MRTASAKTAASANTTASAKTVVITGGTRGIGGALATRLRAEGHRVIALGSADTDLSSVRETAALAGRLPDRIDALVLAAGRSTATAARPLVDLVVDPPEAPLTGLRRGKPVPVSGEAAERLYAVLESLVAGVLDATDRPGRSR